MQYVEGPGAKRDIHEKLQLNAKLRSFCQNAAFCEHIKEISTFKDMKRSMCHFIPLI